MNEVIPSNNEEIGSEPRFVLPGQQRSVERRKVSWEIAPADKARTYCKLMRAERAPISFNRAVAQQYIEWGLVKPDEISEELVADYRKFRQLSGEVEKRIGSGGAEFLERFNEKPWNFDGCVEGAYERGELAEKFPVALQVGMALGEECRYLFRAEPGVCYLNLVERPDGKRQVLRIIKTDRTVEEINADAAVAPDIIPAFEAVKLPDGTTGLLIEWIDGRMPSTEEEKTLCLIQAEKLLGIPMDSFDVWAGNFLIVDADEEGGATARVYYIDRDVVETIAEKGYSEATPERRTMFEKNKEKMR